MKILPSSFLPQLPISLPQWLPVLPGSCLVFQKYFIQHNKHRIFFLTQKNFKNIGELLYGVSYSPPKIYPSLPSSSCWLNTAQLCSSLFLPQPISVVPAAKGKSRSLLNHIEIDHPHRCPSLFNRGCFCFQGPNNSSPISVLLPSGSNSPLL